MQNVTNGVTPVLLDMAPYPTVSETARPDPETVRVLKEIRSGGTGELTAILQYVFQNNVLDDDETTLANSLLKIAIVEMSHLDMLGDAIISLGGKPTYDNGKLYWQGGYVNYVSDPTAILKANIVLEETAISAYENGIKHTENKEVQALFQRIISDEKLHLEFFSEALRAL